MNKQLIKISVIVIGALVLLVLALQAVNSATGYVYLELFWWIGFAALCVCTALTLISGGVYLWKNRSLIKNVK